MSSAGQAIAITTTDGCALAATRHAPAGRTPARRAVLVAGALGVPQRHYAPFCSWLAAQGHLVMSFDPRGIGASRGPQHARSLRGLRADLLSWARDDFGAVVQHLHADSGHTIAVIGHSLGAHHALMTWPAVQAQIAQLVSVAAGAGYWRDWAAPARRRAPLLLHLAGPLLTPLFGYFPGRRVRMVADLPAGVIRQWRRWCLHPGFAWGAEPALLRPSLDAARFTISAFSFSDDESMTEHCTRQLLAAVAHAPSTLQTLQPQALGLERIGHLGAFRPYNAALWPRLVAPLRG